MPQAKERGALLGKDCLLNGVTYRDESTSNWSKSADRIRKPHIMKQTPLKCRAFSSAVVAVVLFGCWAITFFSETSRAQFAFGSQLQSTAQVALANGEFIVCSDLENREAVMRMNPSMRVQPAMSSDIHWVIPGIGFRSTTFAGGVLVWSFSLSLLFPCFAMGMLAGYFFWRCRVSKLSTDATAPLNRMAPSER